MTIIAWMPSAMEIVNAMAFAYRNNIALAIEIGTSASVQCEPVFLCSVLFQICAFDLLTRQSESP